MKRLTILFLLVACVANAQAPRSWPTFMDDTGEMRNVSATYPMPIDAVVTVGSVTVSTGSPPDNASQTTLTTTASAQAITALANRQNVSLFNLATETIWISLGTTTAVVSSGVPIYSAGYFSLDLDATTPMGAVSSTSGTLHVLQTGY
jgi:hypothetical protein